MTDRIDPPARKGLFAELRRRNVFRAAAIYAATVWLIAQVVTQLGPAFHAPDWIIRWFLVAAAVGFPFWIAFAWFYEFTPQGIKRESEVVPNASITRSTARKLDISIIGVLIVAVALLASGYFVHRDAPAATATASVFNPPADTLVVLPFENLSGDKSQQYFSDGITEELTNALGQSTGLKVIAWDTASHYRDAAQPATAIGKALNVANVLSGKILRQGDAVRVIVELVDARSGFQAWASHYDDSVANVFQVQDRISVAIAQALQVKFASLGKAKTVNPQAHDLVLQARALLQHAAIDTASMAHARELIEHALALDPDYADAHAALAKALRFQTEASKVRIAEVLPQIRAEANKALALDPRNVGALIELGAVNQAEGKIAEARVALERALAIDPSSADAHVAYGNTLPFALGVREQQEALRLDPANVVAQYNVAWYLLDDGKYEQALAPAQAAIQLTPHAVDGAFMLAQAYALLHRYEDAAKAFDRVHPDTPLAELLAAAGRMTYQSLLAPELRPKALAAVTALQARSDLAPFQTYYVIQLLLALGSNAAAIQMLPAACASSRVLCNDISLWPITRPLRADPRFEALVKQYDTVSKPAPASAPDTTTSDGQ
ncbi:MAG: hypothetical protein U1F23_00265 [Lysobacterales bacterium]